MIPASHTYPFRLVNGLIWANLSLYTLRQGQDKALGLYTSAIYSHSQRSQTLSYTLCRLRQSCRHPPHKFANQRSDWSNRQSRDGMDIDLSENYHNHNTSTSDQLYIHPYWIVLEQWKASFCRSN